MGKGFTVNRYDMEQHSQMLLKIVLYKAIPCMNFQRQHWHLWALRHLIWIIVVVSWVRTGLSALEERPQQGSFRLLSAKDPNMLQHMLHEQHTAFKLTVFPGTCIRVSTRCEKMHREFGKEKRDYKQARSDAYLKCMNGTK